MTLERIIGDDVLDLVLRCSLNPHPLRNRAHYVSGLGQAMTQVRQWANSQGRQTVPLPVRFRVHPAVLGALGPRAVMDALGANTVVVEAPPNPESLDDDKWLWAEDDDQTFDITALVNA